LEERNRTDVTGKRIKRGAFASAAAEFAAETKRSISQFLKQMLQSVARLR
jgi:hypothetical protein